MEIGSNERPFAVVTGASRGIGAEYARALAAKGYDLLLASRSGPLLDRLAADLGAQYGVQVSWEVLDLAEPDAAHRLFAGACRLRSHTDLLVNNAGFGLYGHFTEMPMARLEEMIRLHVNTVVASMRLFLPPMIERRLGAIINVASVAGLLPVPYLGQQACTRTPNPPTSWATASDKLTKKALVVAPLGLTFFFGLSSRVGRDVGLNFFDLLLMPGTVLAGWLSHLGVPSGLSMLLVIVLTPPLAVLMLMFRGHLFAALRGTSRRQRMFMARGRNDE